MARKPDIPCSSCGMVMGPGHAAGRIPSYAGAKPLCGYCDGIMKRQGYIQVNSVERLLPDGTRITFRIKVEELVETTCGGGENGNRNNRRQAGS